MAMEVNFHFFHLTPHHCHYERNTNLFIIFRPYPSRNYGYISKIQIYKTGLRNNEKESDLDKFNNYLYKHPNSFRIRYFS